MEDLGVDEKIALKYTATVHKTVFAMRMNKLFTSTPRLVSTA
jgi:hypothetical protein